jgi:hypothetical protein
VGGEALRQWHQATPLQQLIGALEDCAEDAGAQIVGVAPAAGQGWEGEVLGVAPIGIAL